MVLFLFGLITAKLNILHSPNKRQGVPTIY